MSVRNTTISVDYQNWNPLGGGEMIYECTIMVHDQDGTLLMDYEGRGPDKDSAHRAALAKRRDLLRAIADGCQAEIDAIDYRTKAI